MLKHLGIFAILAFCLFAITMSGCYLDDDEDNDDVTTEITPIETTPEGMVLIPAGHFQMGSEDENPEAGAQPVHTVHLDAFYMDKYEVTNKQFKAFVDANPQWQKSRIDRRFHDGDYLYLWNGNNYPSREAEHPVAEVSWYAAMAYAAWVGKRLPTEAEWEYAARGGLAGKKYPWGDTITHADANYDRHLRNSTPVGQYAANGYGLYDMAGNVWEWCIDRYDVDFYAASHNSRNPIADERGMQWLRDNFTSIPTDSSRVVRGGSWYVGASSLGVALRGPVPPSIADVEFGFRCAKAATP